MDRAFLNALAGNIVRNILQEYGVDPDRRHMHTHGPPRARVLGYCLAQMSFMRRIPEERSLLYRICVRPGLLLRTALHMEVSSASIVAFLVICQNVLSLDSSRGMCYAVYGAIAALFHRIPQGYHFAFVTSPNRHWPHCIRMMLSSETEV
uniref:ORF7b protein n=1 Tax=Bat Coronavirus RlYN17 TaxID=3018893 RepID=A0AA49EEY6_9NIDO|nr:ORF7b protein [Bat Coronavirus RlYN17]